MEYKEYCESRSTNPYYPLGLIKSMDLEFKKGLSGGFFDPDYVNSKIETLLRFMKMFA